jgi:signal transduction histidine kinase/ligand-binding sensor domain-containing protein/CheY-like chemotaxis protein
VTTRTRATTRPFNIVFLLMSLATSAGAADAPSLILEHLTPAEGMPQGTVTATLQDSQGFVWLGTQDGLVRYDGHELVRYGYSRNAKGLPGNFVYEIAEDRNHDLWVAIKDSGIARWNRKTDDFTVYRHDPLNASSLATDSTRTVLVDPSGLIWVGTSGEGLDSLDPATGIFQHRRHDPSDTATLGNDHIFQTMLDRRGVLWVGTADGLDAWRPERGAFQHFRHDSNSPASLGGTQISQIVEDARGEFWVGSFDGGLTHMNRDGHVSQVFRHDAERADSLSSDDVRDILEDRAGNLWVGTTGGLDLLDSSGGFTHYRHDEGDAGSLRDSHIRSLYEDPAGLVWIGTLSGGVSRWNPRSRELGGHRPAWLVGKLVTSFADTADQKVWIGSLGGGLTRYDDSTGDAVPVDDIVGRRNALGDSRIMSLQTDRRGSLWIGTMKDGLKRLRPDGSIESIGVKVGDPKSVSAGGIMTLLESSRGAIWVGTYGGGVNIVDPVSGDVRQLPHDRAVPGATSGANVSAIAEDRRGYLWLGSDGGGLDLATADGNVIKSFRHDPNDDTSLPSNDIYAIEVDGAGEVWVASDHGGLAHAEGSPTDPGKIRFHSISREEGLSSDTIYAVLNDGAGHLWLSGNSGLMRYDPKTGQIKTYHREQGLQGEEFDLNAYHRMRDGRLGFGGPGGFNLFDPDRLTETTRAPRLALTRLEVLGTLAPTKAPYWLLDRIELDHGASIVSLDFAALDFTSPKRNRLEYRVSGLSERWIELGTQHRVTLTNLDAGDHLLEVRAANADSVWSDPPLRLTVHRAPAPWRSPWAYALYAIALLLLMAHLLRRHRARIRSIVRAKQSLEAEVALRTRELLDSNRRLGEASEAKSNFLARMSHELRTPMNGVVGSSELLARTPQSSTQARLTETIRSSAQVLLQIVNDLLDLSKIQAGKLELEILPFDLVKILEESATLFSAAAENKGVELVVCPPPRALADLLGDSLRIRQILMNLIGNAVKFTLQGEVVIRADVTAVEGGRVSLEVSVTDTGIGMDAATIAKVFEPFTQADESTTRRFGGSGLGLAICRELTGRMSGIITVDSRPAVGSTFRVSLPLGISAAPATPMIHGAPLPVLNILTRRSALREAISRHATAMGMSVAPTDPSRQHETAEELVIVDLGTYEGFVKAELASGRSGRRPLLIVAAASELEQLQETHRLDQAIVVHKPLHRDSLRAALAAAMGSSGAPLPDAPASARPSTPLRCLSGYVLLVEDEPVNAAVAEAYLKELGCRCVWVDNGREAIARSVSERFDLIMMDLNMPVMDGFATAIQIREREGERRVPIVALTAHDADTYRDICLESGMDEVLSKPYTMEECSRLLGRFLMDSSASNTMRLATIKHPLSTVDAAAVAGLRKLRTDGRDSLYSTLVDLFRNSSEASLAQLQAALDAGDSKGAGAACHKLAAAAANVGAIAFSREMRQIEKACETNDLARARELADGIMTAHGFLLEELASLQMRATA